MPGTPKAWSPHWSSPPSRPAWSGAATTCFQKIEYAGRYVFQKIEYARRHVQTVPGSDLVEVAGLHIPTEDSAADVAQAVLEHPTS